MKSPVVIYHAGCWDGFCAAWLLWKCFPDAHFHAAHYSTEPPSEAEDKERRLFIVDFSYPRDVMFRLGAMRHIDSQMTVLDHHKTAQAALEGLDEEMRTNNVGGCEVIFDMTKSGGRLTWEYLYGRKLLPGDILATNKSGYSLGVAPWLVDYTEDRDLWRWSLPVSREITAALRTYPLEFNLWDEMADDPNEWQRRLYQEGVAIRRYEQLLIDLHVKHAREIEMDGHKILVVNATVLFSDIAGELAKDRPFGACYFDRQDGMRQWSLRSREDGIDVSEIAKRHGGGGHKHAAGFEEEVPVEVSKNAI